MTKTQRAAMQQALEFCEELQGGCTDSDDGTVEAITVWCPEAIAALRAALAEPEPELVGWQWLDTAHFRKKVPLHSNPAEWRRLFTEARHTPEAQTDTDEE